MLSMLRPFLSTASPAACRKGGVAATGCTLDDAELGRGGGAQHAALLQQRHPAPRHPHNPFRRAPRIASSLQPASQIIVQSMVTSALLYSMRQVLVVKKSSSMRADVQTDACSSSSMPGLAWYGCKQHMQATPSSVGGTSINRCRQQPANVVKCHICQVSDLSKLQA